jgi:CubicO group peptidase (beta-lactamase class C family)
MSKLIGLSVLAAICTAALAVPAAAQQSGEPGMNEAALARTQFEARFAEFDKLFTYRAAKGGSFILRYDLGDFSFVKAYGHVDCARTQPMTADALVDSGSITKAFTSAAVYKLIERGRLKLDDRLSDLFADVPADKAAITIAQLLGSQSGLHDIVNPDGTVPSGGVEVIVNDYVPLTRPQFLKAAFESPLRFEPGTRQAYSNTAYQLLAAVIEEASGQSYESYVRENILLPAGMKDTGYLLPDFRGGIFAQQCKGDQAWGDPVTKGLWKDGVSWNLIGAGGMMTSVHDLKRWIDASVSGKLFRPDIQKRFRQSTFFIPHVRQCNGEVHSAAGSNGLTTTAYFHLPQRKESLAVSSTRTDHKAPEDEIIGILCP